MSSIEIRSKLNSVGWRQGACISGNVALKSIPDLHEAHKSLLADVENAVLILSLYDCALIDGCFMREPLVSYILAKPIDKKEKKYEDSRNPRVLHFDLNVDSVTRPFEVSAISLGYFMREYLLSCTCASNYLLNDKNKRVLLKWVQKRMIQPTFPDNFNHRVYVGKNKKKIDKIFKNFNHELSGVYIRISPRNDELDVGNTYNVVLFFAIPDEHIRQFKDKKRDDLLFNEIDLYFSNLEGVKLEERVVIAEGQLTLRMLRDFELWSPESQSFKTNPEAVHPVGIENKT